MVDVTAWHRELGRSAVSRYASTCQSSVIARFRDIDARIDQPALDTNLLAIHLGGPKRVIRRQGARTREADVAQNSFTIMPAGEAFGWETFGPIDFAHLSISETDLRRLAAEEFERDPDRVRLEPVVGANDRLIAELFGAMLAAENRCIGSRLYRDALAVVLSFNLVERYSASAPNTAQKQLGRGKLATWQLRRVIDYIREHLADDIDLATLVSLTGLGRARFFQAFKRSMGQAPFAYLLHQRLLRARALLVDTRLPITHIAAEVGLEPTRLAAAFRRLYNITPRGFRAANVR